MNNKAKGIMVLTVVAIFGIATLALAGWGRGYGYMMGSGGWGPGWSHRGGYGYGQGGYYGNLAAGDMASLDQQRAEYFKATENLRQQLDEKERRKLRTPARRQVWKGTFPNCKVNWIKNGWIMIIKPETRGPTMTAGTEDMVP
jgi:hypothetical protein